jgi:hypothetical protein
VPDDPLQVSATSHAPAAARQTKPEGRTALAGQSTLAPVHVSAMSHVSTAGRQTVPDGSFASVGHCAVAPVHVSATSHEPAAGRHTVVDDSNWQVGEQQSFGAVLPSSQASPASRMPLPQTAARPVVAQHRPSASTASRNPASPEWKSGVRRR